MPKVSIVIPAYNEEAFIGTLLKAILQVDLASIGFEREVIVIDDGSKDKTFELASTFSGVQCFQQVNQGKGAAVKNGIRRSTGDYVLVQDADLEYDPQDYLQLLAPLRTSQESLSVYGSRVLGAIKKHGRSFFPGKQEKQSVLTWLANICLSVWTFLLYGHYLTDTLTGYKVYPRKVLQGFTIQTYGFETDHELTAKLLRSDIVIVEVPVSYNPRTVAEGKKIRFSDFFVALWTFLKFRFVRKENF